MECLKDIKDELWEKDEISVDEGDIVDKVLNRVGETFNLPPKGKLIILQGDVDSKVTLGDGEIELKVKVENNDSNLLAANHLRKLAICILAVEEPSAVQGDLFDGGDEDDADGVTAEKPKAKRGRRRNASTQD